MVGWLPDSEPAAFVDKHDPGRALHPRGLFKRGLVDLLDLVRRGEQADSVGEQPRHAALLEVDDLDTGAGRLRGGLEDVELDSAE